MSRIYACLVSSDGNFSGWGTLARVRFVENGRRVVIDLQDGRTGWFDYAEKVEFKKGDVVLIQDNRVEKAPKGAWREEPWVAVVRIKLPDITVVESGGSIRTVPTNEVPYERSNTVEVTTAGVLRVLDSKPIRYLEIGEVDDKAVEDFIIRDTDELPSFEDFGGLDDVIRRARELIETPLRHRDALEAIGAGQISGVLFTGPPGTGKTMLARVIAREAKAKFFHISGPEVVSKWYGQSEDLLRKLFEHARKQDSAILFFDEIDSIAAQRDEDAHEASRRLVAQLLTLMDGFSKVTNVVVIATTNRPQDIDAALRRPGRFDWEITFPLPNENDRTAILKATAAKRYAIEEELIQRVAAKAAGWTGADLKAVWKEAGLLAANDGRDMIVTEDLMTGYERVEAQRLRTTGA